MKDLHPELMDVKVTCEWCAHIWIELYYYEGYGGYYSADNPELRCPECREENAPL